MPSPNATPTPITPPRVPLIDPRTGLIDRAWYMFFLSLLQAAQTADNGDVGPDTSSLIGTYDGALQTLRQTVETQPSSSGLVSQIAELQKQIEAIQIAPQIDIASFSAAIASLSSAPVTKTADFTVSVTDVWLINNKSGSTCVATLPSAAVYSGRELHFQNYQVQALDSASSNVVPLAGGAATASILLASSGDSATLVSDGSNWVMTQYVPNNILLLE